MDAAKVITRYLSKAGVKQADFAAQLEVTPGLVSQWLSGRTAITAERAIQIEDVTKGFVKRAQLRPDLFGRAA